MVSGLCNNNQKHSRLVMGALSNNHLFSLIKGGKAEVEMRKKAKPAGHYSNQGCGSGIWPRPAPVLQSGDPQGAGEEKSEAKQVLGFPCPPFRKVSLALCPKL